MQPQPQQANSPHNQHMCQSIFNTIGAAIQFKLLHHTLKRTFQPVVDVIEGDYNLLVENCRQVSNLILLNCFFYLEFLQTLFHN